MDELCRRVVSLVVALILTVNVAIVLSGCQKKSGPQKAGEKVGKDIENAGKSIRKSSDEASK